MQQAIDILDEMIKSYDNKMYLAFCGNPAIEIDKEAKAKLIEAKSRISALGDGWISTAIQLPPEDTNVLIFEGGQSNLSGWNEPKIGWYNKKFGFQSLTDYLIATHWMPLPNSPKQ